MRLDASLPGGSALLDALGPRTRRQVLRVAGVAAIVSGVLDVLYFGTHPSGGEPPAAAAVGGSYAPLHALEIIGQIAFLLPLVVLYLLQAERVGRRGLVGFLALFAGTIFVVGTLWGDGFFTPVLATRSPALLDHGRDLYHGWLFMASGAMVVTVITGFIVFGIASLRAGVLPRGGVVAMTVGGVAIPLPPPPVSSLPWAIFILGAVTLATGLIMIGLDLIRRSDGNAA